MRASDRPAARAGHRSSDTRRSQRVGARDPEEDHMHVRTRVMPALVGLTLILSACGGTNATSAPPAASSAAPAAVPCPAGSAPAASPAAADLKIGVVTDIGTLNDKNFNEYSFKGAQDGAKAIGAPE